MIAANVKIQEIRHRTLPQPVEQIAERPPTTSPRADAVRRLSLRWIQTRRPATIASVNAIRSQAGAWPNNPKLTPVLKPSTRLKKPVTGMT